MPAGLATPGPEWWAWSAGFFDGEGTTYLRLGQRPRDYPEVSLSITQNHRAVLDTFLAAVGVGQVTGPVNESGTGSGPRWNYRALNTADSLLALERIWPWLGALKREQAMAAVVRFGNLVPDAYLRIAKRAEKKALIQRFIDATQGA